MSRLWRLRHYLAERRGTLALAYGCMVLLAATSAAMAALAGPALRALFVANSGAAVAADVGSALGPGQGSLLDGAAQQMAEALRWLRHWLPSLAGYLPADDGRALVVGFGTSLGPWTIPVALIVTAVFKGLAQSGQFYALGSCSLHVQACLRRDAFAALLAQPPAFFAKRKTGDLLSRLLQDVVLVEQGLFYGLGSAVRDSLALLFLLGFCVVRDAKLAASLAVVGPLVVAPLAHFARRLKRTVMSSQAAQGEVANCCHEVLSGLEVVQACGQEAREARRLATAEARLMAQLRRSYAVRAVRTPTMEIMGAVGLAALLGTLGQAMQTRGVDAAHYVSFLAALLLMYDPVKKLGQVGDYLAQAEGALSRLDALLLAPRADGRETAVAAATTRRRGGVASGKQASGLQFVDVHFAYGSARVLRGFSLDVPRGSQVAVVGESGAGKSTLAQLVLGFWRPQKGAIFLDGRDVAAMDLAEVRAQVALVAQQTFLFATSVAENLAYARPQARQHELEAAARAAHAHDFIAALPQGYATCLGERGASLSGGQRQRLAIARALVQKAPYLLLDEATSSLDGQSEAQVQAALAPLRGQVTCLTVAHRLQTVRHADSIAVVAHGQVVEQGTHAALLRRDGAYARLWRLADASNATGVPSAADVTDVTEGAGTRLPANAHLRRPRTSANAPHSDMVR